MATHGLRFTLAVLLFTLLILGWNRLLGVWISLDRSNRLITLWLMSSVLWLIALQITNRINQPVQRCLWFTQWVYGAIVWFGDWRVHILPAWEGIDRQFPHFFLGYRIVFHGVSISLIAWLIWILDRNRHWFRSSRSKKLSVVKKSSSKPLRLLPPFEPRPEHRDQLAVAIGEAADWRRNISLNRYLYLPQSGLMTNTLVLGSVGAAKTAGVLYPILKQLIDYRKDDPATRIGGLVFDAKGDFTEQVRRYLREAGRWSSSETGQDDHLVIRVGGDLLLNPLGDPQLTPQTMSSTIGSLIQQLMPSREGFWLGAYQTLLTNIFAGLRAAFDTVDMRLADAFVMAPKPMDRLIAYLEALTAHQGCILIYHNLITNHDRPYDLDAHGQAVPLSIDRTQSLKIEDDANFWTEQFNKIYNKALEHNPDLPSELVLQALVSQLVFDNQLHQNEANLPTEEEQPDLTQLFQLPEWNALYQAFCKAYLQDRPWQNKIDQVENALGLLLNPDSIEVVTLPNPCSPDRDAFSHDDHPHRLETLVLLAVPDCALTCLLCDRFRVHHSIMDEDRRQAAARFIHWYRHKWVTKDMELRSKIYAGVENITTYFEDPAVARTFAPSMVTEADHRLNPERCQRRLLPSFDWVMRMGKWVSFDMPESVYGFQTKIFGTLVKQLFQATSLQRVSSAKRARHPDWAMDRPFCLMIDECHTLLTTGQTPDTDTGWLAQNRQCRAFAIYATQTIENIRHTFHGNDAAVKTLLGCMRNKLCLGVENVESAEYLQKLIGRDHVYRVSSGVAESERDSPFSLVTGDFHGMEAGTSKSRSFSQTMDYILEARHFLELEAFTGLALTFDGRAKHLNYFYCKPYWRPFNEPYEVQRQQGLLPQ